MPECYRHEIETVVTDAPHAEILRFDRFLLPNESRNHVIDASREEYVCLIDNDVLVQPGWLSPLLDALNGESAGVARPYVVEGLRAHFDPTLGPLGPPTIWQFGWSSGSPTFKIDIQEAHARFFRAGAITFAIETRLPPATDPGVSLHVFTDKPDGGLIERLRFDCLQDKPHYHYLLHQQRISQKFWIDPLMVPDPKAWSLQRIRHDLKAMFDAAGGCELAALVDQNELERVFPELEGEVQRADALTQAFDNRTHRLLPSKCREHASRRMDAKS